MHRALWGVADPKQLAALEELLEEYARKMGISGDETGHEKLADRILALFYQGVQPEEIRRRLDFCPAPERP